MTLLAITLCGAAPAGAAPEVGPQEGDQGYAVEVGVSLQEARVRLDRMRRSAAVHDEIAAVLGADFAGTWLSPRDGRFKIAVAHEASTAEVQRLLVIRGLIEEADFVSVRFSAQELSVAHAALRDALRPLQATLGLGGSGIFTPKNRINLKVADDLSPDEQAVFRSAITASSVPVAIRYLPRSGLLSQQYGGWTPPTTKRTSKTKRCAMRRAAKRESRKRRSESRCRSTASSRHGRPR